MSDAFVILDSDEEEEIEIKSQLDKFQSDDDEPLFENSTPINQLHQKGTTTSKQKEQDDIHSFLYDDKPKTTAISDDDDDEPIHASFEDNDKKEREEIEKAKKKKQSNYERYLKDLSEDESPPPSPKKKPAAKERKRTLKKPIISKKQKELEEGEDGTVHLIDDLEEVTEHSEGGNSLDELLEESSKLLVQETEGSRKRRSLKDPLLNTKTRDTSDNILTSAQNKKYDSLDDPLSKNRSTTLAANSKKRSVREPTPKRKNSVDALLESSVLNSDNDDDLSQMSQSRKNKNNDLLFSSSEDDDDTSYQKKAKKLDTMDLEGDFMGRDTSASRPSFSLSRPKSAPEQIDLLSDDSDEEMINRKEEKKPVKQIPKVPKPSYLQDEPPRKYKPSSRLKVNKNNEPLKQRKNSVDMTLGDDDDMGLSLSTTKEKGRKSSIDMLLGSDDDDLGFLKTSGKYSSDDDIELTPRARKNSVDTRIGDVDDDDELAFNDKPPKRDDIPDVMTKQQARKKISYEKLYYGSDSSPENSPTLGPKKVVSKKHNLKKQVDDDLSKEFSPSSSKPKSAIEDSDKKHASNYTISIDDTDDELEDIRLTKKKSNNSDDDDDFELDTDSFFDDLISIPKKRKTNTSTTISSSSSSKRPKPHPLECVASSSKATSDYIDFDEPIIMTDRKGKRRAVEIQPPLRERSMEIDDCSQPTNEDELTPKEKRQLQSVKKKEEAQRKREEKQKLKEQQKVEKERQQLYEKANKIKSNRNDILNEIIVDMHPSFSLTKPGQIMQEVMTSKVAHIAVLDDDCLYSVSWRRKCTAEWDLDSQSFIPLEKTKLIQEPFALLYMEARRLVQHIMEGTLDALMERVQASCDGKQLILMIEGLEVYYKKKKLTDSRQFQQAVRQSIQHDNDEEAATTSSQGGRKRASSSKKKSNIHETGPKREKVEEVLVRLQIMRDIMLVPTKNDEDTASWLESLTTDLALGRYKTKNLNNTFRASRCGKGSSDTFFKMLQEIHLCTPAIANSVMDAYPTIQSLYQRYKTSSNGSGLLADLEVQRSAVSVRDRTINKFMSKKIHSIFTCTDPESVIF